MWDLLIDHFFNSKKDKTADFEAFWDQTVDRGFLSQQANKDYADDLTEGYFAKSASDHQKLIGFKIFQKVLKDAAARGLVPPGLFSRNFMSCLMNQASNATPRLHRAAVQCLKAIEKQVEETPEILTPVLKQLLAGNGSFNFDQRVKGTEDGTKTVERVLRFASPANAKAVVDTLKTCALQATDGFVLYTIFEMGCADTY